MKYALYLALVAVALTAFQPAPATLTIYEALETGKVEIESSLSDGFSVAAIDVRLKNLTRRRMKVSIEPGALFTSQDDGEQILMAVRGKTLELEGGKSQRVKLRVYCTELGDRFPMSDAAFTISPTLNPDLQALVDFVGDHRSYDKVMQQAVWCITDGNSISSVYQDAKPNDLTSFLSGLTGQVETWYQVERLAAMGEDRRIINAAKEVRGEMEFDHESNLNLDAHISNEMGEVVYQYPNDIIVPAGKLTFDFKLVVEGWVEGTYTISFYKGEQQYYTESFSI